jgi:hypothetical protein
MQIVLIILLLVSILIIDINVFYYKSLEKANIEIYNLKCKLDDSAYKNKQLKNEIKLREEQRDNAEKFSEKKVKDELYKLVFQTQHYNSVKNLENKIKTVLSSDQTH